MQDYLEGEASAGPFYGPSPFSAETFRDKAARLRTAFDEARCTQAFELLRPAGPAAESALARVKEGGGFLITTGQQPGLFGGPLYSLYKALTAIKLAEEAERVLGVPVLAVFWVASEDHDWDEANHCQIVDSGNEVRTLSLGSRPSETPDPLSRIPVDQQIQEQVEALLELLPPSEYRDGFLQAVTPNDSDAGVTLPVLFERLMVYLLQDFPIAFVQASDEGLKKASAPLLGQELRTAETGEAILSETAEALQASGYASQVALMPGGVNLFVEGPYGRERLYRQEDGTLDTKKGWGPRTIAEVESILEATPETLSPNVLLRPVVESFVFPTLAYVGGPGEMAYFAQLRRFFEHHQVDPPIVFPRHSLLAVESKIKKVLTKFELSADDLRDLDGLLSKNAEAGISPEIKRNLGEWRGTAGRVGGELTKAVGKLDGSLKGAVAAARNATLASVAELEKKIVQAAKKANEISGAQMRKAHVNLWPNGKPQERVLSPAPFVVRYGGEFVTRAAEAIQINLDEATVELPSESP